jgi:hypothetical protein
MIDLDALVNKTSDNVKKSLKEKFLKKARADHFDLGSLDEDDDEFEWAEDASRLSKPASSKNQVANNADSNQYMSKNSSNSRQQSYENSKYDLHDNRMSRNISA